VLRSGGSKRRVGKLHKMAFPSFRRIGHSDTRNVRTRYGTGLNPSIKLVFISRGEANRLCLYTRGAHIFEKFRNKLKIVSVSRYCHTEGPQALISTVYSSAATATEALVCGPLVYTVLNFDSIIADLPAQLNVIKSSLMYLKCKNNNYF